MDLSSVIDVDSAAEWAGLTGSNSDIATLRGALFTPLGTFTLRDIAFTTSADWGTTLAAIKIGANHLTAIEKSKAHQFRHAAITSTAPPAPKEAPAATVIVQAPATNSEKKLSTLFGAVDVQLKRLSPESITDLFQKYKESRGEFPFQEVEPSEDQLSALQQMLSSGLCPYVDFSMFGPDNNKFQENMKYLASRYDSANQTWSKVELPGPRTLTDWSNVWGVFECCLLLLQAVSPEVLAQYRRLISKYHSLYGQSCWFIIYQADIRMRSEQMDRFKRSAIADHKLLSPESKVNSAYDPKNPWGYLFQLAASEINPASQAFWNEHVHQKCVRHQMQAASSPKGAPSGDSSSQYLDQSAKRQKTQASTPQSRPMVCKAYIQGKCFGDRCKSGFYHPPCPCGGIHAKLLCPKLTQSNFKPQHVSPPTPVLSEQSTKGKGGGKGSKGKGGGKGKGSKGSKAYKR